jgi:hypothetical protein
MKSYVASRGLTILPTIVFRAITGIKLPTGCSSKASEALDIKKDALEPDSKHEASTWSIYDYPDLYSRIFSERDIAAEVHSNPFNFTPDRHRFGSNPLGSGQIL